MAAAVTLSPTSPRVGQSVTITGSGFSATTKYVITVTTNSNAVGIINVTSDGSGAFTVKDVAIEPGTYKVDVRPNAEHTGTTSATATASAVKVLA